MNNLTQIFDMVTKTYHMTIAILAIIGITIIFKIFKFLANLDQGNTDKNSDNETEE